MLKISGTLVRNVILLLLVAIVCGVVLVNCASQKKFVATENLPDKIDQSKPAPSLSKTPTQPKNEQTPESDANKGSAQATLGAAPSDNVFDEKVSASKKPRMTEKQAKKKSERRKQREREAGRKKQEESKRAVAARAGKSARSRQSHDFIKLERFDRDVGKFNEKMGKTKKPKKSKKSKDSGTLNRLGNFFPSVSGNRANRSESAKRRYAEPQPSRPKAALPKSVSGSVSVTQKKDTRSVKSGDAFKAITTDSATLAQRIPISRSGNSARLYHDFYATNPTIDTRQQAVSTFSADVNTASYSLVKAKLLRGRLPSRNSLVRTEEFINAFHYPYKEPETSTIAIRSRLVQSPGREGYHVLHIGIKAKTILESQRSRAHLLIILDTKPSMHRDNRFKVAKAFIKSLVARLKPQDKVTIITTGQSAKVIARRVSVANTRPLLRKIQSLSTSADHRPDKALAHAYAIANQIKRAGLTQQIIYVSDGLSNGRRQIDASRYHQITTQARNGVRLTTIGVGVGIYNDRVLSRLAKAGDGQYLFVADKMDIQRVLAQCVGLLQLVARNVKIQVRFDPQNVKRFRLIGYEKNLMARKDYSNPDAQAGDLGSGQSVTALYEIKLRRTAGGQLGLVSVRFTDPHKNAEDVVSHDLQHARAEPFNKAHWSTRLALISSSLAEKLRRSYWARKTSYAHIERLYKQLPASIRRLSDVAELGQLIRLARKYDRRPDQFEKRFPLVQMKNFDRVPILR